MGTFPTSGLSLSPHTPAWLWLVTSQSAEGPGRAGYRLVGCSVRTLSGTERTILCCVFPLHRVVGMWRERQVETRGLWQTPAWHMMPALVQRGRQQPLTCCGSLTPLSVPCLQQSALLRTRVFGKGFLLQRFMGFHFS